MAMRTMMAARNAYQTSGVLETRVSRGCSDGDGSPSQTKAELAARRMRHRSFTFKRRTEKKRISSTRMDGIVD
jgi:hypothetical protein